MDKNSHNIIFSSKRDDWETPRNLFLQLEELFGPFDLDPCATPENTKCKAFFTRKDNGLLKPWWGKVFMNPPYGREIGKWISKAYNESQKGCFVVCLLPARTDTSWFHKFCLKGEILFLKGRLKFGASKNAAPFPSMIVVFRDTGPRIGPRYFKRLPPPGFEPGTQGLGIPCEVKVS